MEGSQICPPSPGINPPSLSLSLRALCISILALPTPGAAAKSQGNRGWHMKELLYVCLSCSINSNSPDCAQAAGDSTAEVSPPRPGMSPSPILHPAEDAMGLLQGRG